MCTGAARYLPNPLAKLALFPQREVTFHGPGAQHKDTALPIHSRKVSIQGALFVYKMFVSLPIALSAAEVRRQGRRESGSRGSMENLLAPSC